MFNYLFKINCFIFLSVELPLYVQKKHVSAVNSVRTGTGSLYLPISLLVQNNANVSLVPNTTEFQMRLIIDGYVKSNNPRRTLSWIRHEKTLIDDCSDCVSDFDC
jgi:hypothetical protein